MPPRVLALPVLAALLAATTGCGIARDALYAPRSAPIAIADWTSSPPQTRTVATADGLSLQGFFWPGAPGDRDIFVFFHGRGAHQGIGAKYAQYLRDRGDAVLVASYRGFGGNPGHPSRDGLLRDAAAFMAEARGLAGPGARLWLVGHSLGAAVALQAACVDNRIAGVITIGAFADIREAAPSLARPFLPDRWDNRAAVRCVRAPVVILHGAQDDVVPPASAAALLTNSGGPATAIRVVDWAHKPVMQTLGPWAAQAIETLAQGPATPLPPLPPQWQIQGVHDGGARP
ncbi:alpha/beta hydrolase [Sphingobium algorifonticola]|uniref:Alpha/beta fold hydrolase n=1 Tax=Sphingobium algorifonticola TaxID=2008318 RepID=A0A437J757_9SPHN|nr:alpha/beta fold hydrolase [Sphingobium algorifonticola]RVT41018.1 alpha/beta fold hydrolase [Sphingobium algorifonticola]